MFNWTYVLSVNEIWAKFKTGFVEAVENRGSYMSAHVLLNLLNKLGESGKM